MTFRLLSGLILLLALIQPMLGGVARFGGTFIGAFVCEDGIIIGADSRSTFLDPAGKPVGYVDGISKVFAQQGAAFAVSGLTSVEKELFATFVRNNDYLLARPPNTILFDVSLKLPWDNTTQVALISAGFVDDEPMICAKDPTNPQVCRKSGFMTNKPSASLNQWNATLRALPKSEDATRAFKQAILETAANDSAVGGPLAILRLRKNAAPEWMENGTRDQNWTRVCDVVNDHRRTKTTIAFTNSKEELDRFLSGTCPIHK